LRSAAPVYRGSDEHRVPAQPTQMGSISPL
jgi:hypothetical protein